MQINEIEIDLQKIKKDILNFIKNSDDFENYLKSGLQKEREVYIDYAIAYYLNTEQEIFNNFLTRLYVNFAGFDFYKKCKSYKIADKAMFLALSENIDFKEERKIFVNILEKKYGRTTCYILSELYKQKLIHYLDFFPLGNIDETLNILTFIKNNNNILLLLIISKSIFKNRKYKNPLKVLKSYLAKKGIYGRGYKVFINKESSYFVDVFKYKDWAIHCFKKNIPNIYFKDDDIIFWLNNYTDLINHSEKQKILSKIIHHEDDIIKFKDFKKHYDGTKNSYFVIDDYLSNAINGKKCVVDITIFQKHVLEWQKTTSLEEILNRRESLHLQLW